MKIDLEEICRAIAHLQTLVEMGFRKEPDHTPENKSVTKRFNKYFDENLREVKANIME